MKKLIIPFFILANLSAIAQTNINIIPRPVELTQKAGYFNLNKSTVIIANTAAKHNAECELLFEKIIWIYTFN